MVLSHYPKIPDSGIKIRAFALLDTFQQKVWLLREQQNLVLLVLLLGCTAQWFNELQKFLNKSHKILINKWVILDM